MQTPNTTLPSRSEASYPADGFPFSPGRNCSRITPTSRAAFLVDADCYYRSFVEAALQARRQLWILGWDTDTRTELPLPEKWPSDLPRPEAEAPLTLGGLLETLVEHRPELEIFVLSWDFTFIYLFEREPLPSLRFSKLSQPRLRLVLDQKHATLGSHHQKVVVVDDDVAFSGGLDLTQRRWDTPEHRGQDNRRVDPLGHCYGPFHDVQICVQGETARALGDLARERWRLATGEEVSPARMPEPSASPWPLALSPDVVNVEVALSRTLPHGYGELTKPVIEVEKLFLDAIRFAKRFVYIENQYFTSPLLAKAIAARLREPDGPEFVMVLPRDQTGWIEESTMGLLRSEALTLVEAADQRSGWRCFYPTVPSLGEGYVKVHSKVMVVDDVFVRVGSANMNSRSMGMDTECDLSFTAFDDAKVVRIEVQTALAKLRSSLAAEHLGVAPEIFEARFRETGSLVKTVDSFLGGPRTLVPMHPTVPGWVRSIAPPKDWIDPSGPRGIRRWALRKIRQHRRGLGAALIFAVVLSLSALALLERQGYWPAATSVLNEKAATPAHFWAWTRSWNAEKISEELAAFRGRPSAIPLILGGFIAGSLCFVPIAAMIFGVALTYPPLQAAPIALCGALLSATFLYAIGRYWAWTKSKTLSQPWVKQLSEKMKKGGLLAVVAVRLTPIAPFAAVGIVAGGLRVPLQNYVIGTALGLLPGILALCWVANQASGSGASATYAGWIWFLLACGLFSFLMPKVISRMKRAE